MIYLPTDIPILPDTSPPTTTEALHALTTLNKYFEALPVSSLQHPTTTHNTSEVSATDFAWMAAIRFQLTASSG